MMGSQSDKQIHSFLANHQNLQLPPDVEEHLEIISGIYETLGIEDPNFGNIFGAISRISSEELSSRRKILELESAEDDLRDHLASAKFEEALIHSWNEKLGDLGNAGESLAVLEKRKATLHAKAKEYQRELGKVQGQTREEPEVTISELVVLKDQLRRKEHVLKKKRAKVQAFLGLPPNLDLARHELQNARDEQMKLIQLRERLLGSMASSVL